MIHANERFSDAVEQAVTTLETLTDAEVVVVSAERSGHYRDLAAAGATGLSLIALIGMMAVPFHVSSFMVVIDVIGVWLLSAWLANGKWFIRRLSSADRRDSQVREAAAADFHREAVHATPDRTGLLIYVSALEGRVEIIADLGLEAKIPRGKWAQAVAEFSHDDLEHFLAGLERVGAVLAECCPATEEGKKIDLPNAPRVR
jgi:putative membrane protein